jgi:hypothetical protein
MSWSVTIRRWATKKYHCDTIRALIFTYVTPLDLIQIVIFKILYIIGGMREPWTYWFCSCDSMNMFLDCGSKQVILAPIGQWTEISVAGSDLDLLKRANRTLYWGCPNSSVRVPQTSQNLNHILIPNDTMFNMIDCTQQTWPTCCLSTSNT